LFLNFFLFLKKNVRNKITLTFITKHDNRISFAMKLLIKETKASKILIFFSGIQTANYRNNYFKKDTQKKVLLNKNRKNTFNRT
jgi:hypothetical protein